MKILFIITPDRRWDARLVPMKFPHLGVAYLAGYLRRNGIQSRVMDTSFDFTRRTQDIENAIKEFAPDAIGVTVYSNMVNEARAIIADARKFSDSPVIVGGPHISATGADFVVDTGVEYGVMQDGEIPLTRLLAAIERGAPETELAGIPGLVYRDKSGGIVSHANTGLVHDLDSLPDPDWQVFDLAKYSDWTGGNYTIVTSRGCPYGCTYCAAPLVTGRKFRTRSAAHVVDEIERAARDRGFKRFGIADDAFNVDIDRAKEVCRLIIARKLKIVWDMGNGIRANTVDREFFQLLKQAGCNFVGFGLESGNPEMLKRIRKGLTLDDINNALALAREVKIGAAVNVIIGHPGETWESAMDTIRIADTLPASYVNVYGLLPMKGTRAYDELKALEKEGKAKFLYDQEYYLSHFAAQGIEPVFETNELTADQRRKLLVMGRNITQRRAFEYRFGKTAGRVLYMLTRNHRVFTAVNNLRTTRLGSKLYGMMRHED